MDEETTKDDKSDKAWGKVFNEIIPKLGENWCFDDQSIDFGPGDVNFEILGKIKPLDLKWVNGTDVQIPPNYIHVPTHFHEFCIEEITPPDHAQSERYIVKSHQDEYFFAPYFNPRDKSNHERVGLCSQDIYDCIAFISRIEFEGNGRRYCLMGLSHSFAALYPSFLNRLEDLFPKKTELLNEYWKSLSPTIQEERDSNFSPFSNCIFPEESSAQHTNKKLKNIKTQDNNNNEKEEEEGEGEEQEEEEEEEEETKIKNLVSSYKFYMIDSLVLFGFLLEMRIIQESFLDYLRNGKENMGREDDIVVNKEYLSSLQSLKDGGDNIELSFIQGNRNSDFFYRYIGFENIVRYLFSKNNNNSDDELVAFERAYIRLDDNICDEKKERCSGNCQSSDLRLDKLTGMAIHFKCQEREKEVSKFRKFETRSYPQIHAYQYFMEDVINREIECLKYEMNNEIGDIEEKILKVVGLLKSIEKRVESIELRILENSENEQMKRIEEKYEDELGLMKMNIEEKIEKNQRLMMKMIDKRIEKIENGYRFMNTLGIFLIGIVLILSIFNFFF